MFLAAAVTGGDRDPGPLGTSPHPTRALIEFALIAPVPVPALPTAPSPPAPAPAALQVGAVMAGVGAGTGVPRPGYPPVPRSYFQREGPPRGPVNSPAHRCQYKGI